MQRSRHEPFGGWHALSLRRAWLQEQTRTTPITKPLGVRLIANSTRLFAAGGVKSCLMTRQLASSRRQFEQYKAEYVARNGQPHDHHRRERSTWTLVGSFIQLLRGQWAP